MHESQTLTPVILVCQVKPLCICV